MWHSPVRSLRQTIKAPDVGSAHSPSHRRLRLGCFAGCVGYQSAWARAGVLSSYSLEFLAPQVDVGPQVALYCLCMLFTEQPKRSSSSSTAFFGARHGQGRSLLRSREQSQGLQLESIAHERSASCYFLTRSEHDFATLCFLGFMPRSLIQQATPIRPSSSAVSAT